MNNQTMSRRAALGVGGSVLAGCSLSSGAMQTDSVREMISGRVWETKRGLPPGHELVSSLEYEVQAKRMLSAPLYEGIAGSNVEPFNRVTFMPEMNIPTLDMDLTVPFLGEQLFAPLIAGPISDLGAYRQQGELETVRGAAVANTPVIVSAYSTVPLADIAAATTGPFWVSVYVDGEARRQAAEAVQLGADALFVSANGSYRPAGAGRDSGSRPRSPDWGRIDAIRQGITVPVVLKGVLTPADAERAVSEGYAALVVSDHSADGLTGGPAPLDALTPIADAVGGRIPVLADGSFRRGSDVLKGLVMGATAVLISRPTAWGLASYGADGVQWVFEKMQTELARNFAMVGASRPDQLKRSLIRRHSSATA